MKKIITAIIIMAISTNLVKATDLSQYPKATNNGQTTQIEAPIIPTQQKKKKSKLLGNIGKAALVGVTGVGLFTWMLYDTYDRTSYPSKYR